MALDSPQAARRAGRRGRGGASSRTSGRPALLPRFPSSLCPREVLSLATSSTRRVAAMVALGWWRFAADSSARLQRLSSNDAVLSAAMVLDRVRAPESDRHLARALWRVCTRSRD